LADNITYYFVVRAYVGTKQSGDSNEASYRYLPPTHTITASAGVNGSISPNGAVSVAQGTSRSFTITPASGYRVTDVLVDGVSVGAVSTYAFNNVTANHTISASFALNTYKITVTAGPNGTISPFGLITVFHGSSQTFSIKPNNGSYIANVIVNGQTIGQVSTYTFTNVTSDCSINASFGIHTYTIAASAGTGGMITPSGAVSVLHGGTQAFAITAQQDYRINNVFVDGISMGSVSAYNFA
jgi:hypothetical protein